MPGKKRLYPLIFIFFLLSTHLVSSNTNSHDQEYKINHKIINAYYDDLDSDNQTDDIKIVISLKFHGFKGKYYKNGLDFCLTIGLIKPDNSQVWYLFKGTTHSKSINVEFDLLNHATVSGWYVAHSIFTMEKFDIEKATSLIFDPPGGQDHGEPEIHVAILYT